MFPAARIGDPITHDLLIPCGIIGPGVPVPCPMCPARPVLIEALPAAHAINCSVICTGVISVGIAHPPPVPPVPPPPIVKGSLTVLIHNMQAARWSPALDIGGCGVFLGDPKLIATRRVLIGDLGTAGPALPLQAVATRTPTAAQVQAIQDAIDNGQFQQAINMSITAYGIDVSNVPNGVQYNPAEPDYGVTSIQGNVDLGPAAMSSPEVLASTITHETTHANQAAALRAANPGITGWPSGSDAVNHDEAMAYDAEVRSAGHTGLDQNQSELDLANQRRSEHLNELPEASQRALSQGVYPP